MLLVTQPLYGPCQPPTPHLHPQPRGNSKLTGDQGHTERLFCQQSSSQAQIMDRYLLHMCFESFNVCAENVELN